MHVQVHVHVNCCNTWENLVQVWVSLITQNSDSLYNSVYLYAWMRDETSIVTCACNYIISMLTLTTGDNLNISVRYR